MHHRFVATFDYSRRPVRVQQNPSTEPAALKRSAKRSPAGLMRFFALLGVLAVLLPAARAAEPDLAPANGDPILRLDLNGPASSVLSLAMKPHGTMLYAGGNDKVIQAWQLKDNSYEFDRAALLRIPIGDGPFGFIKSLAISDGGRWLAVGGRGRVRSASDALKTGWIWPAVGLSPEAQLDRGTIFVFDTQTRRVHVLRGHERLIDSLSFAAGAGDDRPVLISSSADSPDDEPPATEIRIWDVVNSEQLGRLPLQQFKTKTQTKLAAWKTGPGVRDVRVAFLCKKINSFQPLEMNWRVGVYDLARNQISPGSDLLAVQDQTRAFALLPDVANTGRLLSFGFSKTAGRWDGQILDVPSDRNGGLLVMRDSNRRSVTTGVADSPTKVPEAITLFAAQPNGPADHAAVIVTDHRPDPTTQALSTELVILTLSNWQVVGAKVPLWKHAGGYIQPSIVTAQHSPFLAVSGSPDDDILVYKISELLNGGEPQPQRLNSVGLRPQQVEFVKRNDVLGLRIAPGAKKAVVFDPSQGTVSEKTGDWAVSKIDAQPLTAAQMKSLEREPTDIPTAMAVCPVTQHCPIRLAALGLLNDMESKLVLYNADTGQEVRWLSGHTGMITSLAFSGDGKFLVSAADDRTVRVWSTADLAQKNLNQHGLIRGLEVRRGDDGKLLVVKSPDPALEAGDVITSAAEEDRPPRTFTSPWDFYNYVVGKKPGDILTLNVAEKPQPIPLTVSQAIDESKPLFTLFLTAQQPQQYSWIGWHYLGEYEASDRKIESNLGWHFNTGRAQQPVRFAAVDELRDEKYRKNLLEQLLADGRWTPRPPPDAPTMSLHVLPKTLPDEETAAQRAEWDRRVFSTKELEADFAFLGDFPTYLVASVEWRIGAGEFRSLPRRQDAKKRWGTDLADQVVRGNNALWVKVRTNESQPREFHQSVEFQYQAPPPSIEIEPRPIPVRVDKNQLELTIKAGSPGELLSLTASLNDKEVGAVAAKQDEAELPLSLTLQEGRNEIAITASNDAAPQTEITRKTIVVEYVPPQSQPPLIAVEQILTLPAKVPLKFTPGETLVLNQSSQVQIQGTVQVIGAQLKTITGKATPPGDALPEIRVDDKQQFVAGPITLQPGQQTIELTATNDKNESSSFRIAFAYQPTLPDVAIISPQDQAEIYEGWAKQTGTIDIAALFGNTVDGGFEARVWRNGQVLDRLQAQVDLQKKTISVAGIELLPGVPNRIQLELSNKFGSAPTSDEVIVQYYKPPQIIAAEIPAETETGYVDIRCTVRSATKPTDAMITIQPQDEPASIIKNIESVSIEPIADAADQWTVTFKQVPVPDGDKSRVNIVVANDQGASSMRDDNHLGDNTGITFVGPDRVPVELAFLSPLAESVQTDGEVEIQFRVSSPSEIRNVTLRRKDAGSVKELWSEANLAAGDHERSYTLKLRPGEPAVALELTAENSAGPKTVEKRVALSFIAPPIVAVVDEFDSKPLGKELAGNPGSLRLQAADDSLVNLKGHLEGGSPEFLNHFYANNHLTVKIWINGFLHATVPVKFQDNQPPSFAADDLVLNLKQDNGLFVEVIGDGVAMDQQGRSQRYFVDCAHPDQEQRLHLLAVSLDPLQEDAPQDQSILDDVLAALKANQVKNTVVPRFTSKSFKDIVTYGPLTGARAVTGEITSRLNRISRAIAQNKSSGGRKPKGNDVVLFYYQGWEIDNAPNESVLLTSNIDPQRVNMRKALTNSLLINRFKDIQGAHLIVLDVQQTNPGPPGAAARNRWDRNPFVGVLRLVWLGPNEKNRNIARLISQLQGLPPSDPGDLAQLGRDLEKAYSNAQLTALIDFQPAISDDLSKIRITGGP